MSVRDWRGSVGLDVDDLCAVDNPVTAVWGECDPLGTPAAIEEAVGLIDDIRFKTVEAGHIPFLGHPGRCADPLLG